jgi:hypothetical protein
MRNCWGDWQGSRPASFRFLLPVTLQADVTATPRLAAVRAVARDLNLSTDQGGVSSIR